MNSETAVVGARTIHPNNEVIATPEIIYTDEAKSYIMFRRQRMVAARDARDTSHEEFDDMTFLRWYEMNKKADDQYVAPRKNKQDTSLNTGTVRDKDTSLVEYAAKYDFEPVAQVFDDSDDMLEDLAETGEDLVRKSLLMEEASGKMKLVYRAMVAFGTAMVEDLWSERWQIEKDFGSNTAAIGSVSAEWTDRYVKVADGCQMKLWDLRKIYFGDIRKFFLNGPQGQPFMFTVEYESYDVVKQMFGTWDRWVNVPTIVTPTPEAASAGQYQAFWTLRPMSMNYVEIIRYYDPVANEFAITLNGVDMLPIMEKKLTIQGVEKCYISAFPLTAISPSGAIPFAKYDFEPMHDFCYSKSQPAKMRVMADVENMWMKLMIGMMKQRAKPTMGNMSGRNFGPEVTDPGQVINDIRDGDLFAVLPDYTGTTPADMSFYELIKQELDKNSIERSFQGIKPNQQDETATADMNNMKAQSLKIAALFDGIIAGNKQLYWLRTYNITQNWTKPIDVRIDQVTKGMQMKFRTVTVPTEVEGGQKATKKIYFSRDTTMKPEDVHQWEIDYAKEAGSGEVRIAFLHPDVFAAMKVRWHYSCIPIPNGSDPLAYMMFAKQIQDAAMFFGPDSLNVKKLKHKFASMTGNDFDTWFLGEQELQQKQQQAQSMQTQNPQQGSGVGNSTASPATQPLNAGSAFGGPSVAGAAAGKNIQPMSMIGR